MAELTQNEKRLLATLEKEKKTDAPHLAGLLESTPEAVVQWAHLLGDKGLVTVERMVAKEFVCTEEGKTYAKDGLPETQLLRFILPGTQQVSLDAIADGTMQTLIEAGCAFSTPTCGPCLGGHMGVLADRERSVATTNRNFVGRMGHPGSEVYLASPYVAAASAIAGHIATPEMVGAAGAASGSARGGRS